MTSGVRAGRMPLEILGLLWEEDPARAESLRREADAMRRETCGEEIHLRGLIEISSYCIRSCTYCGLRCENRGAVRYRLGIEEILGAARLAARSGCGSVVLQSGEDPGLAAESVARCVEAVRSETGLAVTLSLGERSEAELELWRRAGAARYLLRFETSRTTLFERVHPARPGGARDRFGLLATLRALDYEVGSGVMVGLPGQTWGDLVEDLQTFRRLDLDMIGVGPFVPHPRTPLGRAPAAVGNSQNGNSQNGNSRDGNNRASASRPWRRVHDPVPNAAAIVLRVLAVSRLLCPATNIPATTALGVLDPEEGQRRALEGGANVLMPNLTPAPWREAYQIYPGKTAFAAVDGNGGDAGGPEHAALAARRLIESLGRPVGRGPGASPAWTARRSVACPLS